MRLYEYIIRLVEYGIQTGLTPACERNYARNQLLECFGETNFDENVQMTKDMKSLEEILSVLLDEAVSRGIIEDSIGYRDIFDTRLMNCLCPRPAQVIEKFNTILEKDGSQAATDYFYKLSCDSDYIRRYRIAKDMRWTTETEYGTLDITINLSKPEKDPKAIAAAKNAPSNAYPKCQLCMENEGYPGRLTHPARQNHRIIPITINNSDWGFQYSPYVYYNEHCIVFNGQHVPMKVDRAAFEKLFDFVEQFPHYFLGSNADLPIVGGSILSHDHFQGGHYTFAMEKAPVIKNFTIKGYEDVEVGIVKWPLSVIRLDCADRKKLIDLAEHILTNFREYTDEAANILAYTDGVPHNTITPIARMKDGKYELDLALRNNLTTEEHPDGVYHPHQQYHHIKKENIGLIEVMGLAVLPSRLKKELSDLADFMVSGKDYRSDEALAKHADWADDIKARYSDINASNVIDILMEETGKVFCKVLECAGIYKQNEEGLAAFERFINSL